MTTRAGWITRMTVSLTLSLTALGASAQQTIKIGEINSYKAQPAFLGPYKNGWNLALDQINASGGVLGKQLEVVSRDDNGNPGDTIRVASLDRLARNLDDLRRLVSDLTAKGVRVVFIKEGLTFTGDDSAMARLLLSVMGAFAEFERSLIRERQAEGIAVAKASGVYKGRAKALTAEQVANARQRVADGVAKAKVAREFGVSRQTLYSALSAAATEPAEASA